MGNEVAGPRVAAPRGIRRWVRAVGLAVIVSSVTTVLLLLLPHVLLTQLLVVSRGARVALATVWVAAVTGLLLWIAWRVSVPRPTGPKA